MTSAQDRADVIDAATTMMWRIDTRDWDAFPAVFADSVRLDYTAILTAVFQAIHLLANPFGSPRWTLGGTYRIGLLRSAGVWLINDVAMTPTWADGNKEILTLASGGVRPESRLTSPASPVLENVYTPG
ncbi:hypothetical protein AB0L82_22490 [Nocardia sp. NPDC052001]|uniref:hypothetical protein n=1 Tax=Nocardia sp. NPDC052001 TaxID=3154853 RepID=UPI0034153DC0